MQVLTGVAEQNKTALGALLDPLSQQLKDFKGKVEEVYVQEGKDRTALTEQVKQLLTLNQTLSQDAEPHASTKGQCADAGRLGRVAPGADSLDLRAHQGPAILPAGQRHARGRQPWAA